MADRSMPKATARGDDDDAEDDEDEEKEKCAFECRGVDAVTAAGTAGTGRKPDSARCEATAAFVLATP